jgi:hypothetical protein
VLFGIALLWVIYVVAVGLRRNARFQADNQANLSTRPVGSPMPSNVVLHPPPDLYRQGHAATRHPAA